MSPDAAYRTDLPPENPEMGRSSGYWRSPSGPVASDNAAESKVVLYGPRGEALIRQEPRKVGFRQPKENR